MPISIIKFVLFATASLTLIGCATGSYQMTASNNGAVIKGWQLNRGYTMQWAGSRNEQGFAHGEGVVTMYAADGKKVSHMVVSCVDGEYDGPYILTNYQKDAISRHDKGTFNLGKYVGTREIQYFQPVVGDDRVYYSCSYNSDGMYHGRSITKYYNGEFFIGNWVNGELASSQEYYADLSRKSTPQTSGGNSSDVGDSILGLIGVAGGVESGDGNLIAGGLSQIEGDNDAALRHYQRSLAQQARSAGQSGSSASGGQSLQPGRPAQPRASGPLKTNLIDAYGLGKYRGASGDHITYYIQAADDAYKHYKQSRNEQYYRIHKEYADTAKQFHKQTSTKGTRLGG